MRAKAAVISTVHPISKTLEQERTKERLCTPLLVVLVLLLLLLLLVVGTTVTAASEDLRSFGYYGSFIEMLSCANVYTESDRQWDHIGCSTWASLVYYRKR